LKNAVGSSPIPSVASGMASTELNISSASVSEFADLIKRASGVDINVCYQCRKCASGCPVAYAMDYTPAQILHAARLGLRDIALGSATIWLCSACETCVTRCPQQVDLVKAMDSMRMMALRERVKPRAPEVAQFYRYSLQSIGFFGRMYELGLMGQLKLFTRQFRRDLELGLGLFKRGKLNILPNLGALGATRKIVSRVRKLERR
jgi:heterodisulfide reductase subunit C